MNDTTRTVNQGETNTMAAKATRLNTQKGEIQKGDAVVALTIRDTHTHTKLQTHN